MKRKIITVLLLVIAVIAVMEIRNNKRNNATGCASGVCTLPIPPEENMPEGLIEKTSVAKRALPKLIDLGASSCIPCKMMAPILDEMKETFSGHFEVEFIDVRENKAAAKPYNIRIIPTQIFYDAEGKELFRHEGFFAREELLKKWKQLGYDFAEQQ